ncbi:MAG TPA: glycosyltransferase [Roseiflexaceae bacterium]|nr:glycosyltransferase [Roseiflexaceae bacterium]
MYVFIALLLSAVCLLAALFCLQDVLRERRVPTLAPGGAPQEQPLVSVLIPARDEAARIGPCIQGLARQSYRTFELIVVDDHSSDDTVASVCSYAARLPRLELVRSAPLPAGWAGKCWACWQAAGRARGDWLLFLDADVMPEPALLAALLTRAQARSLDLLTLMPLQRFGSLAERMVMPAFLALLYSLYPLAKASDPRSPIAFANGPCLLIRRHVYFEAGGHQAVRASILEDVHLGRRVKAAGYRLEAAAAPDLIALRMYNGWHSLAEGLGKNAVAGYRSGGARSGWVGMRQALIAFLPLYVLVAGGLLAAARPGASIGAVLLLHGVLIAALSLGCWGLIARMRYRIAPWWGALFPIGTAIYFWLAARALLRLRSGRGVIWKGRSFG